MKRRFDEWKEDKRGLKKYIIKEWKEENRRIKKYKSRVERRLEE